MAGLAAEFLVKTESDGERREVSLVALGTVRRDAGQRQRWRRNSLAHLQPSSYVTVVTSQQ